MTEVVGETLCWAGFATVYHFLPPYPSQPITTPLFGIFSCSLPDLPRPPPSPGSFALVHLSCLTVEILPPFVPCRKIFSPGTSGVSCEPGTVPFTWLHVAPSSAAPSWDYLLSSADGARELVPYTSMILSLLVQGAQTMSLSLSPSLSCDTSLFVVFILSPHEGSGIRLHAHGSLQVTL